MKYLLKMVILALAILAPSLFCKSPVIQTQDLRQEIPMNTPAAPAKQYVKKKVFKNGITGLVRSVKTLPKVTLQIWYHVGSKDEKTGERGIAHLIEHMIFKGTKKLSESDINIITHLLSGSTNAFTSYDYTGYLFNMPEQNWREILPIFADCMQNVSFKDDHLNSEMKAVIQELKMGRDNNVKVLLMDLLASIFPDHPYHYPVIGFKQDLFNVHANDLRAFYKKHYWPNNASVVIVGDVDEDEALSLIEKHFASIPANPDYKKEQLFYNQDIVSQHVTLYRDVKQPVALAAYLIPGISSKTGPLIDALTFIIGSGKGSRLHHKLVDELQIATSIAVFPFQLFQHGLFLILYEPKNVDDVATINALIQEEIDDIITNGLGDKEVERALKQAKREYYSLLEVVESQATEIGKAFLATGDENFAFHFLDMPFKQIEEQIQALLAQNFRQAVMHTGLLLPLPESEKAQWVRLQQESDEYDKKFLEARPRSTPIEAPLAANKIHPKPAAPFEYPQYQTLALSNGLKVLYYNNTNTPTITIEIQLKALPFYDSETLPGLYRFWAAMMDEGTKKYTAAQLAQELETRGMALSVTPGTLSLSLLSSDLQKGLELLQEIITQPRFDEKQIEKVRAQLLSELKNFWDDPNQIAGFLTNQKVYEGHPYGKNMIGTQESLSKISKKDLLEFHKKYISPAQARVAIVGDLTNADLKKLVEQSLGKWQGQPVATVPFPDLKALVPTEIYYPLNRDQVVLVFAGVSVERKHLDFDKLVLFEQIFGGGALGSLHSKLFQLREQSGLFYSISGTLATGADLDKGKVQIKTMVSLDRLAEAEKAIKNVVATVIEEITEAELQEAKDAVINSIASRFSTNKSMAVNFLGIDRLGLPVDYYDNRAQHIASITLDEVKKATAKVLRNDAMITIKVGRSLKKKEEAAQLAKDVAGVEEIS